MIKIKQLLLLLLLINFCYFIHNLEDGCAIGPTNKVDCGWFGITKAQCQARRIRNSWCCFDVASSPQCYHSNLSHCAIPINQRWDCGSLGISRDDCETKGCCFDGRSCFYATNSECVFEPSERRDCGWHSITREECELKGCCYETTHPFAYCYHSKGKLPSHPITVCFYLLLFCLFLVSYCTFSDKLKTKSFY
eukprot:TRINITY_DN4530_c2_g1_i1.p1 TRINITY_DN4530_c2_g1~~TRINITY_DN4530_c2_g1_i1.p1  ORF type:complete len:193 (+),score=80.69 TRINITY_DN4530_c2_g1_i1:85-663(+)